MTDRKFHITARGNAERCRAEVMDCPLQGEHYATREAAMEAYEAENSESSIPLVASRRQTADSHQEKLKEQDAIRKLAAILSEAEPLPGADAGEVKRLKAWAAQEAPHLSGVPGMKALIRESGSEGEDAERRNRFIVDAMPNNFELKGSSAVAYWSLASTMSLKDLRRAEDRIDGDRIDSKRKLSYDNFTYGGLRFNVDGGRTTVDGYLQNAQDADSDRLTVSKASVDDYNGALIAANRAVKEYDRALRADGKMGYPKTWIAAKREMGFKGNQPKAPKIIRISDYGDRISTDSGIKGRMNRLFGALAG